MTPEPRTGAGTSSTTCDTGARSPGRARGPWGAVDADKLRDALARLAASTRGSPPPPAMGFGAFVRGEVDRSPEQELGFAAMGKFLKCDPMSREIESLRKDVAELKACGPPLTGVAAPRAVDQEGNVRRPPKRDRAAASRRTDKQTKKMVANNLLLKLEKLTLQDIRDEFGQPSDSVIETELAKRIFSKSAAELTPMLHEQFGYPLSGQKTLTRTPKYIDWAPHRARGNSRRLDPESPAVDATAAGGKSSKSGATRNSDYVASNGLSEGKFRKTPTMDAEGRRKINDDHEGKAFLRANPELFGEHLEGDE